VTDETANSAKSRATQARHLELDGQDDGTLVLAFSGGWVLQAGLADRTPVEQALDGPIRRICFDCSELTDWDSALLTFLAWLTKRTQSTGIELDYAGLPEGASRLLALAHAVPERATGSDTKRPPLLARIGATAELWLAATRETLTFLGDCTMALGRFVRGRAQYRRGDLWLVMQECGAGAVPIISLISFLVGLILAFGGAIQLRQFGALLYVADGVGVSMTRDMSAMMTGIIVAGRTGASFAAQIGTMTVNEEVDALATMGISSIDFLVLPRALALAVMTPLLCLYANLLGILGGAFVGIFVLDLGSAEYWSQTQAAITLPTVFSGLFKGGVYGVIVALSGCLRGIQCGRSAAAVGLATTSAVVTSITLIVVAAGLLTVIYDVLGI
jgi:phospholipid/cholesterol/gamma-HCH transport system permease protein